MPKDEFDFGDPMELNGVGLVSEEDTTEAMTECFIEEFMRLGYNHKQILALFRNPHYIGMNMVVQNRGEPFVRDRIAEIFARWGKPVVWSSDLNRATLPAGDTLNDQSTPRHDPSEPTGPHTDPMGAPIPDLNL